MMHARSPIIRLFSCCVLLSIITLPYASATSSPWGIDTSTPLAWQVTNERIGISAVSDDTSPSRTFMSHGLSVQCQTSGAWSVQELLLSCLTTDTSVTLLQIQQTYLYNTTTVIYTRNFTYTSGSWISIGVPFHINPDQELAKWGTSMTYQWHTLAIEDASTIDGAQYASYGMICVTAFASQINKTSLSYLYHFTNPQNYTFGSTLYTDAQTITYTVSNFTDAPGDGDAIVDVIGWLSETPKNIDVNTENHIAFSDPSTIFAWCNDNTLYGTSMYNVLINRALSYSTIENSIADGDLPYSTIIPHPKSYSWMPLVMPISYASNDAIARIDNWNSRYAASPFLRWGNADAGSIQTIFASYLTLDTDNNKSLVLAIADTTPVLWNSMYGAVGSSVIATWANNTGILTRAVYTTAYFTLGYVIRTTFTYIQPMPNTSNLRMIFIIIGSCCGIGASVAGGVAVQKRKTKQGNLFTKGIANIKCQDAGMCCPDGECNDP